MKIWLTATLAFALTFAASVAVQADTAPTAPVPVLAPVIIKDGPFRLLLVAKAQAHRRQMEGFHTEIVDEKGFWWVISS